MLGLVLAGLFVGARAADAPAAMADCPFDVSNLETAAATPPSETSLYGGQIDFSVNLFKSIVEANKGQANVFLSPYSVFDALLLTYFASAGSTEQDLKKVLGLPDNYDKGRVVREYKMNAFLNSIRGQNATSQELASANRMFLSSELPVRECMKGAFKEEFVPLDFRADPEAARKTINDWVAATTKNNILDFLPRGLIDPDTKLAMVNAAYFKGLWQSQFLPESTKKDTFYKTPDTKMNVEMMMQKGTFNYMESKQLGAHVLELKYKDDQIKMFVILPPFIAPNAIHDVIDRLDSDILKEIVSLKSARSREVQLYFPKFAVELEIELLHHLSQIGAGEVFSAAGNFSGLVKSGNVRLGSALHKAKVEVNEKGTKAAAATAVVSFRSARPLDSLVFKCNHPFVYLIYDKIQNAVLFAGVYYSPTKN
ncbi:unnamed protein product [Bemisia tabaci]|uniref:Serpin domain-containing protein n=1 Tax=Bemisia tabaci TaxID=7038 RepID=A0A9P0G3R6_BEMTA|nr:unnamed protein product [Bemisia tabaci]